MAKTWREKPDDDKGLPSVADGDPRHGDLPT